MRPEHAEKKFILSHIIFLLSLILISNIPRLYPVIHEKYLPPMDRLLRFYIIGVISIVFLAYFLCAYFYKKSNISLFELNGLSVYFWSATILVFLILCTSSALLSHDLFEYSIRGRTLTLWGLNPYLHPPLEINKDAFFPLIFWKKAPELYGPLWVFIGAFHTIFFKGSLLLTTFMHKLILLIFFILSLSVFYKLCKEIIPEDAEYASLVFLLNPLILIMTLVDGHNEIAMVFFILLSFYQLVKARYAFSLILLALAINVKFVYVFIVPLFILFILLFNREKNPGANIIKIITGIAISFAITVLLWLPFGMDSVKAVFSYYADLNKLFWIDSIPYAVYFILNRINIVLSKQFIGDIFFAAFVFVYIYATYSFFKKSRSSKKAIFTASSLILLALIFTSSTGFQAWYLIWVIPLIYLSDIRFKYQIVFIMSYFLIMSFWKRMSVLAVPMAITYLITALICKRHTESP